MSLVPSTMTNTRTEEMLLAREWELFGRQDAIDWERGGDRLSDWGIKRCLLNGWFQNALTALLQLCLGLRRHLVKFRRQLFAGLLSQRLLDEAARFTTLGTGEAFGFNFRFAGR